MRLMGIRETGGLQICDRAVAADPRLAKSRRKAMRALRPPVTPARRDEGGQAWADLERAAGRPGAARRLYGRAAEANPRLPSVYNAWAALERVRGARSATALPARAAPSASPPIRFCHHHSPTSLGPSPPSGPGGARWDLWGKGGMYSRGGRGRRGTVGSGGVRWDVFPRWEGAS